MSVTLSDYLNLYLTRSRIKNFFSHAEMKTLDESSSIINLQSGENIYQLYDSPAAVFCLESGSIFLETAKNKPVIINQIGTVLGSYSLLLDECYKNTAFTLRPSRLVVYPKKIVLDVFAANPARSLWLLRRLAKEVLIIERRSQRSEFHAPNELYSYLSSNTGMLDKRTGKYYIQLEFNDLVDIFEEKKEDVLHILNELADHQSPVHNNLKIYSPHPG
ncbi:MAG: hypothetical protein WD267_11005 [Balneolales bacterium]